MLLSLRIQHLAIVDDLAVEFGPGFTAVTGETGAGKSILVDALSILLGGRASAEQIRTGEETATVEGLFALDERAARAAEAIGIELEASRELVVKRSISRSGKGKVFLNGGPATVAMLSSLSKCLVDIAGQHDHQTLLDRSHHRALVDAAGGHAPLADKMAEAFAAYERAKREAEALASKEAERSRREDYLRFQVEELREANVAEGEAEALVAERLRLLHGRALADATAGAEASLYSGDGSVVERLRSVHASLSQAARIDSTLADLLPSIESARVEVEEVARTLRDRRDDVADPGRADEIEARLSLLERLRKKHGLGAEEGGALPRLLATLEAELAEIVSLESTLLEKRAVEAATRRDAESIAAALTVARQETARSLGRRVAVELGELGMPRARFIAEVRSAPLSSTGADEVEFRFSANPGEAPRGLSAVASGGELSRVLLALHGVIAKHHPIETYLFDEIDAGVGGAVADLVGKKLAAVAQAARSETRHQVLAITHLAPIAARADVQLRVEKAVVGGRTRIDVRRLDRDGREEELARMLGGLEITATTRAHAREMLSGGEAAVGETRSVREADRRSRSARRARAS